MQDDVKSRKLLTRSRKMAYSLDLRKRVVDYVENGGGITKAPPCLK